MGGELRGGVGSCRETRWSQVTLIMSASSESGTGIGYQRGDQAVPHDSDHLSTDGVHPEFQNFSPSYNVTGPLKGQDPFTPGMGYISWVLSH